MIVSRSVVLSCEIALSRSDTIQKDLDEKTEGVVSKLDTTRSQRDNTFVNFSVFGGSKKKRTDQLL